MHLSHSRSALFLFAVLTSIATLPAEAGKHRAVRHLASEQITIGGTVVDAVTGAPVKKVSVRVGSRTDQTDSNGKFSLKVSGSGSFEVEATRTGYQSNVQVVQGSAAQNLLIRLNPTPTVRVRKTSGTLLDIDNESLEFGYPIVFAGYVKGPDEEFCTLGGTKVTIDRSQMRKIAGPAVVTTNSPCCPGTEVLSVNVEQKSGEKADLWFFDSCSYGGLHIDLIGRDHTSGLIVYIPFTEIAEIVFP